MYISVGMPLNQPTSHLITCLVMLPCPHKCQSSAVHLMQLYDLVDLLVEHLETALPQLGLGSIRNTERIGACARALHACGCTWNAKTRWT